MNAINVPNITVDGDSANDNNHNLFRYESSDDCDMDSHHQEVEITFTPTKPQGHRRKSSMVDAEQYTPTDCFVHQFIDSHRRSGRGPSSKPPTLSTTTVATTPSTTTSAAEHNDQSSALSPLREEPCTPDQPQRCGGFGQADEKEWADHMMSKSKMQMMMVQGSPQDSDESPSGDEAHSRLLTKRQLNEMVWGVRELGRRLGNMKVRFSARSILILTKIYDEDLIPLTRELVGWLLSEKEQGGSYVVYVAERLRENRRFDADGLLEEIRHRQSNEGYKGKENHKVNEKNNKDSEDDENNKGKKNHEVNENHNNSEGNKGNENENNKDGEGGSDKGAKAIKQDVAQRLRYWDAEMCRSKPHLFDFVITLGGDGTVLFASWLFQRIVPPVLSFSLGSLGFLTKFDFADYQNTLTTALTKGVTISLRLRFEGTIMRSQPRGEEGRRRDLVEELIGEENDGDDHTHRPDATYEILNEIVVDRGPNPTLSNLEIFGDDEHFTSVLADGICVSTPTGSTAYNLASGGSLCHPDNPVMLMTAICAHTLSFRPLVLPDTIVLRVGVPYSARTTSWASFDGRERTELRPGDYVTISASRYPFACVQSSQRNGGEDWVRSISHKLGWNTRQKQKEFKAWDN